MSSPRELHEASQFSDGVIQFGVRIHQVNEGTNDGGIFESKFLLNLDYIGVGGAAVFFCEYGCRWNGCGVSVLHLLSDLNICDMVNVSLQHQSRIS
jgi:hypothetical protein